MSVNMRNRVKVGVTVLAGVSTLLVLGIAPAYADARVSLVIENNGSQALVVTNSKAVLIPSPTVVPGTISSDCDSDLPTSVIDGEGSDDVCSVLITSGAGASIAMWIVEGTYNGQEVGILSAQLTDESLLPVGCECAPWSFKDNGDGEYQISVTWTDADGALQPDSSAPGSALGAYVGSGAP